MSLCTRKFKNQMMSWRHYFHQNPELGFCEKKTSTKITQLLTEFGLNIHSHIGKTGVVGLLIKNSTSNTIAIRADMDALQINEMTNLSYRSKTPNVMHACGHDGHMAMLLGAAKYLAKDNTFKGNAIFIFQPNEENGLGAKAMIKDGLFERFHIDEVYAMHNLPGLEAGIFATRKNAITASESLFQIDILSENCHSALPHMSVDPIVVASEIILATQTIVSRKVDPRMNSVFSITEIKSDGGKNILPSSVTLKGDTRALDGDVRKLIERKLREIVMGICKAHGVSSRVRYRKVFPVAINSEIPTNKVCDIISETMGKDRIRRDCNPMLFSEDFSFLLNEKPGCFLFIGNGLTGAPAEPLHSPYYDFNDEILVSGSSMWVNFIKSATQSSLL